MVNLADARGKPRYYKGLELHPIKMKDIQDFYWAVECLSFAKSSSDNLKVLRMTYLEFLINLMLDIDLNFETGIGSEELKHKFSLLCTLVFKSEEIKFKRNELGVYDLVINSEITINGQDFEDIKLIIGEQNGIELVDKFMAKDVRKKMAETREFLHKQNSQKMAQLDQQIIAYHCVSRLKYEEIDELTIYQFQKGLSRFNHMMECSHINNGIYSGTITLKKTESAPNWLDLIKESDSDSQMKINSDNFIASLDKKGLSTN